MKTMNLFLIAALVGALIPLPVWAAEPADVEPTPLKNYLLAKVSEAMEVGGKVVRRFSYNLYVETGTAEALFANPVELPELHGNTGIVWVPAGALADGRSRGGEQGMGKIVSNR